MIHFDYGANSANFRVNKNSLIPTTVGNSAGLFPTVLHNSIFISPDEQCRAAFKHWLDTIVTSMKAVANKQVYIKPEWISGYLQFCALMDIALAEAKRDLTMVNFTNPMSTNSLRDFWGPTYETIISSAIDEGPKYWSRWNSLAKRMAEQFPHLDAPYFAQFRQFVGLGFADSNSGRARYLFYHMCNTTFRDVANGATGVTLSATGALDAAESIMRRFEEQLTSNDNTTTAESPLFTHDALAEIKSLILNAYGAAAAVDYGVVIDYTTKPTITYDRDLVNMLNNAVTLPNVVVYGSTSTAVTLTESFPDLSGWATICAIGAPYLLNAEEVYLAKGLSAASTSAVSIANGYSSLLHLPLTLVGPEFDGATGLYNTSMIQSWTAVATTAEPYQVVIDCNSHFGVTQGSWFHVTPLPGTSTYTWDTLYTSILDVSTGTAMNAAVIRKAIKSISVLNQFDFGNFYYYRVQDNTSYYYMMAEPLDEFALISRSSISTYTDSAVVGLFDASTTSFRTTRTGKYVTGDNKSSVVSSDRSSGTYHGGRRDGKRTKTRK